MVAFGDEKLIYLARKDAILISRPPHQHSRIYEIPRGLRVENFEKRKRLLHRVLRLFSLSTCGSLCFRFQANMIIV